MSTETNLREPLKRVVIAVPLPAETVERIRTENPGVQIDQVTPPLSPGALHDADAAMLGWFDRDGILDDAPRLRWIQTGGAGVEQLPLAELAGRNILLTNASGVHVPNMPEHILVLMLAFARDLPRLYRSQLAGHWFVPPADEPLKVFELAGQTVLLAGMGDIGLGLGERAAALGMKVIGVRRRVNEPAPEFVDPVYGMDQLAEVLPLADHVVNSLPFTAETRGIFDAAMFSRMKEGAFVYNVGRGGTMDTNALIDALGSGRLGGAGLDVTDPEPLPADSPLYAMPNVIITSHEAGATPNYMKRAGAVFAENIRRYQSGEQLKNEVDLGSGY